MSCLWFGTGPGPPTFPCGLSPPRRLSPDSACGPGLPGLTLNVFSDRQTAIGLAISLTFEIPYKDFRLNLKSIGAPHLNRSLEVTHSGY